jgi:hypothetical protein
MRRCDATEERASCVTRKMLTLFGEAKLSEASRKSGWLRRRRKLTPMAWVSAIVMSLGGSRVQWLADIWRSLQAVSGTTVRYKPFHKQLCRPGFAEFFRMLFEQALHVFCEPVLRPQAARLGRFRDIVIHDGTSFALKESLADAWPGRFTTVSPAARGPQGLSVSR